MEGYYVFNGSCTFANPLCSTYDMSSGVCLSCYWGFALWGSTCVEFVSINPYCLSFSGLNCTACQSGYVINNGVCTFANPNCASYDIIGSCLNCSQGYLSGPLCLVPSDCLNTDQSGNCIACPNNYTPYGSGCVSLSSLYPFCTTFVNSKCTGCNYGYYLNGVSCVFANNFCATFDLKGNCLSCNQGYILSGALCVVISTICKTSNATANICTSCQSGFFLSGKNCVARVTLDPFCMTFGSSLCTDCVTGYYLKNDTCIYPSYNCGTTNTSTGKCLSCHPQYFLLNQQCYAVNPLCNGFDLNGNCTKCFTGYTLNGSVCVTLISLNPFCFSFKGSACAICKYRYYINSNGICIGVNPLCNLYNKNTGFCLTCVSGYSQVNGSCLSWISLNPQCINFNKYGNCIRCGAGYFIGSKYMCTAVNPLCNNYNMYTGNCNTCIVGYSMSNGNCLAWSLINPQCLSFNNTNGNCINCANGFFKGTKTICTKVNPLCGTYSMNSGKCYTCIAGYSMLNGSCFPWSLINPQCLSFDNSGICLNCSSGYYIGTNSMCAQANSLCSTYDMSNGLCITCISGYAIQNGSCLPQAIHNYHLSSAVPPTECLQFDNNGACLNCSSGYYIDSNSICTPVNPLCNTYDMSNGQCITCV